MTRIFKNYSEFYCRDNKEENGVSEQFAEVNPNWESDNEDNKGCWNCSDCSDCSDCSRCSDCSDCSGCSGCSDCSRCSDLENATPVTQSESVLKVPVIENIHSKVLEASSRPSALEMDTWHTCDTTHCRAGWVVHLAGEPGYALEKQTSTLFAAMQIYHKSSRIKVSPPRFFESNNVAMADIKRCAEEEMSFEKTS